MKSKTNSSLKDLYISMKRVRVFEERVAELFVRGETAGTMLHLSIGEELGAACVTRAMQEGDSFTTHHRGHGIFLARGGNPNKMMAEIAGKKDGYCKGKGGSMHIADMKLGHLGANAIVGGGIPTVVGAALSYKYFNKKNVSIAFFGDGAMQQGLLYESMNMAALWNLPVIFCCINNQYGMGTKIDDAVGLKDFSSRAKSFGLNCLHVNHLDVEKAFLDIKDLVEKTRENKPSFIEIECYRFYGHARKDKSPYRSEQEELEKRKFDPIVHAKNKMIQDNLLNEIEIENINEAIEKEMDVSMNYAIQSPLNNESEIFKDVYDESHELESVDSKINNILNN